MVSYKILYDEEKKVWEHLKPGDPRITPENIKIIDFGYNLYRKLKVVKKDLHKDKDVACLVTGVVGCGKSNLARCMARFVSDENFHPKTHVVKNAEDIERVFGIAKRFESVIFDEGSLIFTSTNVLSGGAKYATAILDVCRQRNLFIIIVAPKFHRLSNAIAIERTKFLVRSYFSKHHNQRGPFSYYGNRLKEKLYYDTRKHMGEMSRIKPKWRGFCMVDLTYDKEYREMKDETFKEALASFSKKKQVNKLDVNKAIRDYEKALVERNTELNNTQLSKLLDCSTRKILLIKSALKNGTEVKKA